MNHKIKRKWCSALRGGTWTQIKGQYTDGDRGRCPLGILADVVKLPMPALADSYYDLSSAGNISGEECAAIAWMNDAGKPFPEIADWIEKNL